jgi:hypothetical protein
MAQRRRLFLWLASLGFAAALGCTSLTFDCVGICGTEVGNGDFEGIVTANTEAEARAACEAKTGCDAGFTATCSCYLQQGSPP